MPPATDKDPYSLPQDPSGEENFDIWDRLPAPWPLRLAVAATCAIGVCIAIIVLVTSEPSESRIGVGIGFGMALGSLSTVLLKFCSELSDKEVWNKITKLFGNQSGNT